MLRPVLLGAQHPPQLLRCPPLARRRCGSGRRRCRWRQDPRGPFVGSVPARERHDQDALCPCVPRPRGRRQPRPLVRAPGKVGVRAQVAARSIHTVSSRSPGPAARQRRPPPPCSREPLGPPPSRPDLPAGPLRPVATGGRLPAPGAQASLFDGHFGHDIESNSFVPSRRMQFRDSFPGPGVAEEITAMVIKYESILQRAPRPAWRSVGPPYLPM